MAEDIIDVGVGQAAIASGASGPLKVIVLRAADGTARLKFVPVESFRVELESAAERAKALQITAPAG